MTLPTISIVTISFNQAQYLREAIDSILNQEYPHLQYIVVDPGSTDSSRELIDSYGPKIAERAYERDSGPADGLNHGFARATGDVLGYLNADDVLLPGTLRKVAEFFASAPNVDVVSGHANILGPDGQTVRESYSDRFRPSRVLYRAANVMQPSTFFRRAAYARTKGFNVANRLDWDTELFLDMHAQGALFANVDEVFSGFRLHATTVTSQHRNSLILRQELRSLFENRRGRRWKWYDHPIRWSYLAAKYLGNPKWIRERLFRGRVAGRSFP